MGQFAVNIELDKTKQVKNKADLQREVEMGCGYRDKEARVCLVTFWTN